MINRATVWVTLPPALHSANHSSPRERLQQPGQDGTLLTWGLREEGGRWCTAPPAAGQSVWPLLLLCFLYK